MSFENEFHSCLSYRKKVVYELENGETAELVLGRGLNIVRPQDPDSETGIDVSISAGEQVGPLFVFGSAGDDSVRVSYEDLAIRPKPIFIETGSGDDNLDVLIEKTDPFAFGGRLAFRSETGDGDDTVRAQIDADVVGLVEIETSDGEDAITVFITEAAGYDVPVRYAIDAGSGDDFVFIGPTEDPAGGVPNHSSRAYFGLHKQIEGGDGNDFIDGFGGIRLSGGLGNDTFFLAEDETSGFVMDFTVGEDAIGVLTDPSDFTIAQNGKNTAISTEEGEVLMLLLGVDADTISETDFKQLNDIVPTPDPAPADEVDVFF